MSDTAIRGIDVHTYLVKDPARAIAFYRDVMEMKPTFSDDATGAEFDLGDGATFGLWKMTDGTWVAGTGVMFSVPDARAAADYYRARGAKVMPDLHDGDHCTMAFVEDTEGNHFILHTRKQD
jgi:predicted enzyme related to lactoylglutathione lyase